METTAPGSPATVILTQPERFWPKSYTVPFPLRVVVNGRRLWVIRIGGSVEGYSRPPVPLEISAAVHWLSS